MKVPNLPAVLRPEKVAKKLAAMARFLGMGWLGESIENGWLLQAPSSMVSIRTGLTAMLTQQDCLSSLLEWYFPAIDLQGV